MAQFRVPLAVLCLSCTLAAADPFTGSWTANLAKSTRDPSSVPERKPALRV